LEVIARLTLQFLLALCGDVHPNPGPCKSKKSKTNNRKTNAENPPINTNGESAKMFGASNNLLNWNARGLGRVKEQKVQDLLGLMNENDVHIAIVYETRESAGSQNQTQTQANGYTTYKNAYHDISHTSQYLSPEKMVWGVRLIVKNGLAFSISKIHDLTLGARLVHGTLTIPTKGHAQPMKVDILGVHGPATKDFAVNLPYWETLTNYVANLHKLHHLELTQGTRHIIIGGDWNSYLDQNLDIYRDYNILTPECIDPHLSDFIHSLATEDLFFTDLMAVSKLTPYADYTYATKKLAYRSILDRVFTTIGKQHCNPTTVLDWGENFSDHRPVQISIDLNFLC
jgi:exonuclease III